MAPLDSAAGELPGTDAVVIVASSYNGQPTDDAREFVSWLQSETAALQRDSLFAVLGVGDHNWADTYQAIPILIDDRLTTLGGRPLVPRASADTSGDLTATVEQFEGALWAALAERFGDPDATPLTAADEPLYDLRVITGPVTTALDERFAVQPMTVTLNDELVGVPGQQKHYVRVALPQGLDYSTGDHLTVLADNPPDVVDTALEMLSSIRSCGCRSTLAGPHDDRSRWTAK